MQEAQHRPTPRELSPQGAPEGRFGGVVRLAKVPTCAAADALPIHPSGTLCAKYFFNRLLVPLDDGPATETVAGNLRVSVVDWGREAIARAELEIHNSDAQGESLKLLGLSDFLARMATRDPGEFSDWLNRSRYERAVTPEWVGSLVTELESLFPADQAERSELRQFQRALRKLRYRVQRAVIWRHLARRSTLSETVEALTVLADGLLNVAVNWCEAVVASTEGQPNDSEGNAQQLVIFALGKLGGRELNLSSDIDLICAYPESGKTAKTQKTNQQFFVQVVQLLVKTLGETTGDGFGFRIDLRLRPYGDSGPVVQPFAAMERYFETSGREWERYALIKARPCAGNTAAGAEMLNRLRPFVYRRYLDFAAIDSMREMRALIRRDHGAHLNNVKLGAGGIRDVEFLVQMLQLIWGGRVEALQTSSLAHALDGLVDENLITREDRQVLWASYEFSRDVEHCLQAFRDEQTHSLPKSEDDQLRLATALEFPDYSSLVAQLRELQRSTLECLARWLDDDGEAAHEQFGELNLSDGYNFREAVAGRSAQVLADIRESAARSPEGAVAERLERLLPLLIEDIEAATKRSPDTEQPLDIVLLRLEPLLKNVMRRSAYLVLLSENAPVRRELVSLTLDGDYFTSLLAKHPALLEELFMRINLAAVPKLADLHKELNVLLPVGLVSDLQQEHFDNLAQYKSQHQFRSLLALSRGDLTVMQIADYLTRLAQSVIEVVLRWAWMSLDPQAEKVSEPLSEIGLPEGYVVIGYGKLGGFELGAGSDLDLVFLHNRGLAEQSQFHQLTRRLLSYLGMQTYFGPLYEVDIRLRPAGRDGTMVSTLAGFESYQEKTAWLWEHQALLRARVVAGCDSLTEAFNEVRRKTVGRPRDLQETRLQIVEMRERMRAGIAANTLALRLKQGEGGIVDIEFMVQYLALGWSAQFPSLLDFTDNAQILQQASREGLLTEAIANQVVADYAQLRHASQMLIVSPGLSSANAHVNQSQRRVALLWQQLMVDGVAPVKLTLLDK